VSPVDASLDRTFTFRPASYRLPFSEKARHRKWLKHNNYIDKFKNCVIKLNFNNIFIRLRRKPRLRAETSVCMKRFGESRHSGVQARPWRLRTEALQRPGA